MKILLTVGHSILKSGHCTSADGRPFGGVLEYAYNKAIVEDVAAYLRSVGHTVDLLICPELRFVKSTEEKLYKLKYENAGNYDFVGELHLNASPLHNAKGCEVLYKSEDGKVFAEQIQKQLATVFKDRGAKKSTSLYMLNKTIAPANIIESFFCDSSADCELAEKTDVALLIAQGIHGGKIAEQDKPTGDARVLSQEAIRSLQEALNADKIHDSAGKPLVIDGIRGQRTAEAISRVLLKSGAFDISKGRYAVGSTGQVVQWLQMRLNTTIGNDIIDLLGAALNPDGKLGADTRLAVGLFQEMRRLEQDYIVGPKTIAELLYN